MITATQNFYTA